MLRLYTVCCLISKEICKLCPTFWFPGNQRPNSWDKSLKSFPPCYSQSPLLTDFIPPAPPPQQKWFETGLYCKHCIWKPKVWKLSRLHPETSTKSYVHEFGFWTRSPFICVICEWIRKLKTLSWLSYKMSIFRSWFRLFLRKSKYPF